MGINSNDTEQVFREDSEKLGVTWPCAFSAQPRGNPIADLYRVRAYPTIYVLDAEGRIRFKGPRGSQLDQAVAELLAELK